MIYFGSFWGCVGSIFGRFGGVLGGLLVVLGGLGRLLGGSWRVLDGSWGVLGRHGSTKVILEPASRADGRHLGPPRSVKMRQKSDPEGIKIDDENEVEKRSS